MKPFLILIVFLSLVTLCLQQCPTREQQDLLQSGTHFFYRPNPNLQRHHLYTVTVNYPVPSNGLEVAASPSTIQVYNPNGIDFSVRGSAGSNRATAQILLLIDPSYSWNHIRVHYLISSRPDFHLGTFSADIYLAQKHSSGNSIALKHQLGNFINSQKTYYATAMLGGLRTTAATYSISLNGLSVNSQQGDLTLLLNVISQPQVELIFVTFVIFQSTSPIQYSSFNPANPSSANYQLVGLDSLDQNSNSVLSGAGFSSASSSLLPCVGSNCPSLCVPEADCTSMFGFVADGKCLVCGLGQVRVGDLCRNYGQLGCGNNMYFNGTGCQCVMGHVQVGADCHPSCGLNSYVKDSQCLCFPNYAYSVSANGCIKQDSNSGGVSCTGAEIEFQGRCICPGNLGYLNGTCGTCPARSQIINQQCVCLTGLTLNSITLVCQSTLNCGANQVPISGSCVCPLPFAWVNGNCVQCPSLSNNQNGQCVCQSGYTLNVTTVSCQRVCQVHSTLNSQGDCQCIAGYTLSGGVCVAVPTCGSGQTWNGVECVCQLGQYRDNFTNSCTFCNTPERAVQGNVCGCSPTYRPTSSGCVACHPYSTYNSTFGRCVCRIGYVERDGECIIPERCPFKSTWNPDTNRCDCQFSGQYVINGFCQPCPLHATWNGSECVCTWPWIKNGSLCMYGCPSGSQWDGSKCVCTEADRYFIEGDCKQCDPNTVYDAVKQMCECKDGWYGSYRICFQCDSSCAACSDAGANKCTACPVTYQLSNGACVLSSCAVGTYRNPTTSNCEACLQNCAACQSSVTCSTCNEGYTLSTTVDNGVTVYSCQVTVVSNSNLALAGSVTGNGVVYQGVTLSLMPTEILAMDCSICDSLLLVTVSNTVAVPAISIEYVLNSQYWFVISFSFSNFAFIPTFDFIIRLNPTYGNYFSNAQMQQVLTGTLGTQSIAAMAVIAAPTLLTSVTATQPTNSGIISQATVDAIFA